MDFYFVYLVHRLHKRQAEKLTNTKHEFLAFSMRQKAQCVRWYIQKISATRTQSFFVLEYYQTSPMRPKIITRNARFIDAGILEHRRLEGRLQRLIEMFRVFNTNFSGTQRDTYAHLNKILSFLGLVLIKFCAVRFACFLIKFNGLGAKRHRLRSMTILMFVEFALRCELFESLLFL